MKLPTTFLLIIQLLFVSLTTGAHGHESDHDKHDGMHIHVHDDAFLDNNNSDHETNQHIHFTIDLLQHNEFRLTFNKVKPSSEFNPSHRNQYYRPAVPPPDNLNLV